MCNDIYIYAVQIKKMLLEYTARRYIILEWIECNANEKLRHPCKTNAYNKINITKVNTWFLSILETICQR